MFLLVKGSCIVLTVILFVILTHTSVAAGEVVINQSNITEMIRRIIALEPRIADEQTIKQYVSTFNEANCWNDIDYTSMRRASWPPILHTSRCRDLALAYYDMSSEDPNRIIIKRIVIRAIEQWLKMGLKSNGWWSNEVGVPEYLSLAAFCLGDQLPDDIKAALVKLLKDHVKIGRTGVNMVWLSQNTIYRGLLSGDIEDIVIGFKTIQNQIYITDEEGLQSDLSFHQHGPVLMTNSYGLNYVSMMIDFIYIAHGTPVSFSPDKRSLIVDTLLDATSLMSFKGLACPATMGRTVTTQGRLRIDISDLFRKMLKSDPPRSEELNEMLAILEGTKSYHARNRMFYNSDIMIHQRPEWQLSIKMFSDRVVNSDWAINQEGKKNAYLSHGSTFLLRGHDEYVDIPGIWDWQYIPGATVAIQPEYQGVLHQHNMTAYAGGASDGLYGVAGFHLNFDGLNAKLAWFCFDDGYLVLGTDIKHKDNLPIVTTLDQCYLRTAVWTGSHTGNFQQLSERLSGTLQNTKWIWHDGVVYQNYGTSQICLGQRVQTGNWGEINIKYQDTPDVQSEVFRAWFRHTDGSFAYRVLPNISIEQVLDKVNCNPVNIVQNNSKVMAVYHPHMKMGMAVFFEPGLLRLTDTLNVEVNRPVILLIKQDTVGGFSVDLSSPTHEQQQVVVSINQIKITIELPKGINAGNSVRYNW